MAFSGAMDWLPNIDGVTFFVREVLPLVRQRMPGARLSVVGRNPSRGAGPPPLRRRRPLHGQRRGHPSPCCAGAGRGRPAADRRRHPPEDPRGLGHGQAGGLDDSRRRGPSRPGRREHRDRRYAGCLRRAHRGPPRRHRQRANGWASPGAAWPRTASAGPAWRGDLVEAYEATIARAAARRRRPLPIRAPGVRSGQWWRRRPTGGRHRSPGPSSASLSGPARPMRDLTRRAFCPTTVIERVRRHCISASASRLK